MQIFFTNVSFAATTCPITFSKEFKVGEEDESIYVLQQILNSDKRTVIAISGVGSSGKETGYFGAATKKALKRFQALFIEYIGVADGVLNERTRIVLQNVCERKAEGGIDVGQISNNLLPKKSEAELQKNIGGKIILRLSTQQKIIERQEQLKIALEVNAEDLKIDPEVFIVEGGSVQSIRKLGKLSYLILIGAEESANSISVQIEADRIKDANGNTNEEASNEIIVKITGSVAQQTQAPGIIDRVTDNLSDILGRITGEIKTKNCNGIDITTSGDCPGTQDYAIPNNQNSAAANNPVQQSGAGGEQGQENGGQAGGMGSQISQMLSGLLGSLGGKGGAGQGPNGQGGDGQGGGQGGDLENPNDSDQVPNSEPISVPENLPEICKKNYGIIITGGCSTKDLKDKIHKKIADAGMAFCAQSGGKPVEATSIHRTKECNTSQGGVPNSRHLTGAGIDVPPGSAFGKYLYSKGLKRLDEGDHWHFEAY